MFCIPSFATCSGSGLVWTCTAGSTAAQIITAISSASDQAVVTLQNGTYTATAISLDGRNGISILCATVGGCTMSGAGDVFTLDTCGAGDITNVMRISGFKFTAGPGTANIFLYCPTHNITKLVVDNNDFSIPESDIAMLFGLAAGSGHVYGVVYKNNCHGTNNFMCMKNISGGTDWVTGLQGSSNNLFFEDNTCNFTNMPDNGTGCVDDWRANGTVFRFNTSFNGRFVNHSYCHEGPTSVEMYGNTINTPGDSPANFRNIHHQGSGEIKDFFNTVERDTTDGTTITVQHFRGDNSQWPGEGGCNTPCDGTTTGTGADSAHANDGNRSGQVGYPCWHQPGRDVNAVLQPVYSFGNQDLAGNRVDMVLGSAGNALTQVVFNRDIYNGVSLTHQTSPTSPFDGTTGVGIGTLANRPTTCTATAQSLDAGHGGVGYWATDQGNWNSSGNGFGQGELFICSATNTWTLAYTPFTYPHPLRGGVVPPVAPTGVMFVKITDNHSQPEGMSLGDIISAAIHGL